MKIQTICKNTNDNCCNNVFQMVFPQGVGLITGTATNVDLNSNNENPCGNQVHPVFDASLFSSSETQFGLHIKNKVNNYNFSLIAQPDSVALIFKTENSIRKLSIYEDKITICDGTIESPIVTLSDLFTIGLVDEDGKPKNNP